MRDLLGGISLILFADAMLVGLAVYLIISSGRYSYWPAVETLALIATVLVALLALVTNLKRADHDKALDSAESYFSKAYETLASSADETGRPMADRKTWLDAARLLQTAIQFGSRLEGDFHRTAYERLEDFWRSKLYTLVRARGEGFPPEYFAKEAKHFIMHNDETEPLAESSLAAIYRFCRWPEGRQDPLEGVERFSRQEINHMRTFGPRGLGRRMEELRQLRRSGPETHR